jgi:hypothetical protein
MSDSASGSIPNFMLFGDKYAIKIFFDKMQPNKLDTIGLNINEENPNLDYPITHANFVKNNKNLECRFISIDFNKEEKEIELKCKIYKIFQNLKSVRANGFIFLLDGGDLRIPFSIVENQLKSLKSFFDNKELNKRIALCYFNFDENYKLIYDYQKRILSSIFEANLSIEFLKISNKSEDLNNFTNFVVANSSVSEPKSSFLILEDSYLKIVKELSDNIKMSASLIENLKNADEPYLKNDKTSTKLNASDRQRKLVNHSDLVNQNVASIKGKKGRK